MSRSDAELWNDLALARGQIRNTTVALELAAHPQRWADASGFRPYGLSDEQMYGFRMLHDDEVEQLVARQRRERGPFYDGITLVSAGVRYRIYEGRITR